MLYLTKQIRIESTRSHDILRTRGRLRKKRRLSFALKITEFHPLWATFLLLLLLLCTSRRELKRCLRRFLVRRLEGNRRTIFSSTLSGGEVGQTQKKTIQRNAYLCGEGVKKKGETGFIQGSNYPWRNEGGRKTVSPGSRVFTGRAAYISIPRPPPPKKAKRVDVA